MSKLLHRVGEARRGGGAAVRGETRNIRGGRVIRAVRCGWDRSGEGHAIVAVAFVLQQDLLDRPDSPELASTSDRKPQLKSASTKHRHKYKWGVSIRIHMCISR